MRPPRFRLRSLLIAVAILATLLGVGVKLRRDAAQYDRLSRRHSGEAGAWELRLAGRVVGPSQARAILGRAHWHDAMAEKYRRAAARPWLPVAPDPPPPE
jgi:hypothetical protein